MPHPDGGALYDAAGDPVMGHMLKQISAAHDQSMQHTLRMYDIADQFHGQEEFPIKLASDVNVDSSVDAEAGVSEAELDTGGYDALEAARQKAANEKAIAQAKKMAADRALKDAEAKTQRLGVSDPEEAVTNKKVEQLHEELDEVLHPVKEKELQRQEEDEDIKEWIEDMEEELTPEQRAKREELRRKRAEAARRERLMKEYNSAISRATRAHKPVPRKWVDQLAELRKGESAAYKKYVHEGVDKLVPAEHMGELDQLVDAVAEFPVQMMYERLDERAVGWVDEKGEVQMSLSSSGSSAEGGRRLYPVRLINDAVVRAQAGYVASKASETSGSGSSASNRAQRRLQRGLEGHLPKDEEAELRTARRLGLVVKDADGNYKNAGSIGVIDVLLGHADEPGETSMTIEQLREKLAKSSDEAAASASASASASSSDGADDTRSAQEKRRGDTGKYAELRHQLVTAYYESKRGERSGMKSHLARQMQNHINVQRMKMRMALSDPALDGGEGGEGKKPMLLEWQSKSRPPKKFESITVADPAMRTNFYSNPIQGLAISGNMTVRQGREMAAKMVGAVNEKDRVYKQLRLFADNLENTDFAVQAALGKKYKTDEDRSDDASRSPRRRRTKRNWTHKKRSSSSSSSSRGWGKAMQLRYARAACQRNILRIRSLLIDLSVEERASAAQRKQLSRALIRAIPLTPLPHPTGDTTEFGEDPEWMASMDQTLFEMAYEPDAVHSEFKKMDEDERARAMRYAAKFNRDLFQQDAGPFLPTSIILEKGGNARDLEGAKTAAKALEAALDADGVNEQARMAANTVLFVHHHPTGAVHNVLRAYRAEDTVNIDTLLSIQVSVTTVMQAYRQMKGRQDAELEALGQALPKALIALYDYWQNQLGQVEQMLMIQRMIQRYALLSTWQMRERMLATKARLHRLMRRHIRGVQRKHVAGPTSLPLMMALLSKVGQASLTKASAVSDVESSVSQAMGEDILEVRREMRSDPASFASVLSSTGAFSEDEISRISSVSSTKSAASRQTQFLGPSAYYAKIAEAQASQGKPLRDNRDRAILASGFMDISTMVNIYSRSGGSVQRLHNITHPDLDAIAKREAERKASKSDIDADNIVEGGRTRSSSRGSGDEDEVENLAPQPKDMRVHGDADGMSTDVRLLDGIEVSFARSTEVRDMLGSLIAEQDKVDKERAQDMGQDMATAMEEARRQENELLSAKQKERNALPLGSRGKLDLEITRLSARVENYGKGLTVLKNATAIPRLLQNIRWGCGKSSELVSEGGKNVIKTKPITRPSAWLSLECMRAVLQAAYAGSDLSAPETEIWSIEYGPRVMAALDASGERTGAMRSSANNKWVLRGGPDVAASIKSILSRYIAHDAKMELDGPEKAFNEDMRVLLNHIEPRA